VATWTVADAAVIPDDVLVGEVVPVVADELLVDPQAEATIPNAPSAITQLLRRIRLLRRAVTPTYGRAVASDCGSVLLLMWLLLPSWLLWPLRPAVGRRPPAGAPSLAARVDRRAGRSPS
jgi:hypothetical protein